MKEGAPRERTEWGGEPPDRVPQEPSWAAMLPDRKAQPSS